VWHAGTPLLFQDELFTVAAAADLRYRQILTHFGFFDHCIPLSLYAKLLTETIGLDEWALRLPGIAAGVATLCLVAAIGWRALDRAASVMLVALFAGSPYVVYLTREARPYPIVMLFAGLACLLVFSWMRNAGRSRLLAAAACAALALWFHPIVLPSVGVLALASIAWAWSARRPDRVKDVLWAGALFLVLALPLLGPPSRDLLQNWSLKGHQGHMTLDTLATGLMLLLAIPVELPFLLWIGLAALGFVALGRRLPRESAILTAMTGAQVLALRLAQPAMAEVPHVCLRYLAHLLPFLFAAAVAPIAWLVAVLGDRAGRAVVTLACCVALAFPLLEYRAGRYTLGVAQAYNMHPWIMYLPEEPAARVPAFYRELAAGRFPDGALLEAPAIFAFPLYAIYQRVHDRAVYMGAVRQGGWQSAVAGDHDGIVLRRVIDLERLGEGTPPARFLVFHKRVQDEMSRSMEAIRDAWPERLFLPPAPVMRGFALVEYGDRRVQLPASIADRYPVLFEDDDLIVFDLAAHRASDLGRRLVDAPTAVAYSNTITLRRLERPEWARFEAAYERVSVLPKIGPINAYRRRDWLP